MNREQKIKENAKRIVETRVLVNLNELVQELGSAEHCNVLYYDDLIRLQMGPIDWETTLEALGFEEVSDGVYTHDQEPFEMDLEEAQKIAESMYHFDPEYREPMQYWAVDDWLFERLEEQGELVVEIFGINVWARTTCGNAVWNDGEFLRISENQLTQLGAFEEETE